MLAGMRVLAACSLGGAGHLNPLLPFLAAARRRGDDVLVIGPPSMGGMVERAGYPFLAGAEPPEEAVATIRERLPVAPPLEASVLGNRELFGRLATTAMLPGMEHACAEWAPDLVLRDPCEYASAVVAGRLGIPTAQVAISLAQAEAGSIDVAAPALEQHRHGLGRRAPGFAVPDPLPGFSRSVPVPDDRSIPRAERAHRCATAGLVGRIRSATRLRDVRDGARLHDARCRRVPDRVGRRAGSRRSRVAHRRSPARPRRPRPDPGQRPRRGVGRPGPRLRRSRPRRVSRRIGHGVRRGGGGGSTGRGPRVRRPVRERPPGRPDRSRTRRRVRAGSATGVRGKSSRKRTRPASPKRSARCWPPRRIANDPASSQRRWPQLQRSTRFSPPS